MGLEGTWHNELGSTLTIQSVAGGEIRGTYKTAVSSTGCAKGAFPVSGRVDAGSQADQPLGFVVAWVNGQSHCNSATAWSGQYQLVGLDPPYQEQIFTTWLLTSVTSPQENWASTLVGQDLFRRGAPSEGESVISSRARRPSHP